MGVKGKYFEIKQDRHIENAPVVKGLTTGIAYKTKLDAKESLLYVKETAGKEIDYIDFIDTPLLLVSSKFKQIIKTYNKGYSCKLAVLAEESTLTQSVYWNIEIPEITCISKNSEYYPDGMIKRPVIMRGAAEGHSLFKVAVNRLQTMYIIRLDLAESALRRNLNGFTLERLEEE